MREVLLVLGGLVWFPLTFACCGITGSPDIMFRLPLEVAFGWLLYVRELELPRGGVVAVILCGAALLAGAVHVLGARRGRWSARSTLAVTAILVLGLVGGAATAGLALQTAWLATSKEPVTLPRGGWWNSTGAIGRLKAITDAQARFREGDRDEDGVPDYGSLEELARAGLVDDVLGGGSRHGYLFEAGPSVVSGEYLWWATATPQRGWGDRQLFVNQAGVIYYTTSETPPTIDRVTCQPPAGWPPLGR